MTKDLAIIVHNNDAKYINIKIIIVSQEQSMLIQKSLQ